jgi:hypothetical protein
MYHCSEKRRSIRNRIIIVPGINGLLKNNIIFQKTSTIAVAKCRILDLVKEK